MVGIGAVESVSWADAAVGFSDIVAEQIAVVPVNMVNVD